MLVFADRERLQEIALPLLTNGSEIEQRAIFSLPIVSYSVARRTTNEPTHLTEEQLAHSLRERLPHLQVDEAIPQLRSHRSGDRVGGEVIGVKGILDSGSADAPVSFHGQKCLCASMCINPYALSIMVPEEASGQAAYYNQQMMIAYGICKWTKAYRPGSGADISLALQVIALFEDD